MVQILRVSFQLLLVAERSQPHLNGVYVRFWSPSHLSTHSYFLNHFRALQLVVVFVVPRVFFFLPLHFFLPLIIFKVHSPILPCLFFSDSTLSMGGSDSRGSIHQILVEREVISIGDSSSKEVCHKSSNNGSFSFERLMDSHHVGEGSSEPREKVRPSTTPVDKEPILVTIILPFSPSMATGRSDSGDARFCPTIGLAIVSECPCLLPSLLVTNG